MVSHMFLWKTYITLPYLEPGEGHADTNPQTGAPARGVDRRRHRRREDYASPIHRALQELPETALHIEILLKPQVLGWHLRPYVKRVAPDAGPQASRMGSNHALSVSPDFQGVSRSGRWKYSQITRRSQSTYTTKRSPKPGRTGRNSK
jgi:hypothetical protein